VKRNRGHYRTEEGGFTLLEMMIVIVILGIVTGAVLMQFNTAQQRISAEEVKVDNLDEARDFVDQFFRDINQIGYPNVRMADTTQTWSPALASPLINDSRFAVGLVKIDANELRFEGDVNGAGVVQSLVYVINGSGTCGACLQRSQTSKVSGNPLTGQNPSWGTEVNDIVNTQVFTYFDTTGTKITALPADINSAPATLASVKTIQISVTIRNNSVIDPKTGQPIETNFEGEVSLNNCSMAANAQAMSCQ
jgi:prepilin-type N-terminal cleavage/methylation domain-containing protein